MTQQNPLDLKGSFLQHPFAELLLEIGHATLDGSLRLSVKDNKTVVYFDKGKIIFAVSNSKSLRLFNVMLERKKIDKQTLVKHPNFSNDLEFSMSLQQSGTYSKKDVDEMISVQVEAIVADVLSWPAGEWHFSPLARLRGDIRYPTNVQNRLLDHGRTVPIDVVAYRFRNINDAFILRERVAENLLQSHELHVLALIGHQPLTIEQLCGMSTLPGSGMLQALYVLWLGGIIDRLNWAGAFTRTKVDEILSANIHRVKTAEDLAVAKEEEPAAELLVPKAAALTISLKEFLEQVESAETHYDTLGLSNDANIPEIKQMYFGLAKLFHPDKYHRETPEIQKRVQSAFTDLAHAYETLKSTESRDSYNFKMRKEIDAREKRRREGQPEPEAADTRTETALEAFEQALNLLNREEYDQAAVLLGRAVHYSPDNAQFHAYYGQALSYLDGQIHKAEGELQTAVRLDPKNVKIRMMLVDFLIDMDMLKRAVGELNRFLQLVPGNRDAASRLERLQRKEQKGPIT